MTRIIVLTGPPAGGKSTVRHLFEDIGVPTVGTGDGVRATAQERYDDPDEDDIWETAQWLRSEHGPAGPTVAAQPMIEDRAVMSDLVVVSDLRYEEEVDFLEEEFGPVLVISVDTRNRSERVRRYVDREVGNLHEHEAIPAETETRLRDELREREAREAPYPKHHLTLLNDNSVRMDELMCKIQRVCQFVDPNGDYDAGIER